MPPTEIAVGIPAELLRRRPDIRRAEHELDAQTARIGAAVGELYPKFSILGSFGLDARDFSRLFDANSIGASVGPSMQWNILNFGKFRCNVYVQESRQRQRCLQYQNVVLRAAEEVDNALVNYVRRKQRQTNLLQAVAANQRAVDLSQKRYVGGDVSFQRVLDSQRSLLQSQDQLALNEASIAVNLIQLYRALGGGWERAAQVAENAPPPMAQTAPPQETIPAPVPLPQP
jgi:outer membrane protein TolC